MIFDRKSSFSNKETKPPVSPEHEAVLTLMHSLETSRKVAFLLMESNDREIHREGRKAWSALTPLIENVSDKADEIRRRDTPAQQGGEP